MCCVSVGLGVGNSSSEYRMKRVVKTADRQQWVAELKFN